MKPKTIYIIAGHSIKQPGALAATEKYEHEYTRRVQDKLASLFKQIDVEVFMDNDGDNLYNVIQWVNQTCKPGDRLLDIHFNNNNPEATGTEVFVFENTSQENKDIASNMVRAISKVSGLKIRRKKPERDYKFSHESNKGSLGILEKTKPASILIEICFLNYQDIDVFEAKFDDICKAIVSSYT